MTYLYTSEKRILEYKTQEVALSFEINKSGKGDNNKNDKNKAPLFDPTLTGISNGVIPVSYTHLDVYKRQDVGNQKKRETRENTGQIEVLPIEIKRHKKRNARNSRAKERNYYGYLLG